MMLNKRIRSNCKMKWYQEMMMLASYNYKFYQFCINRIRFYKLDPKVLYKQCPICESMKNKCHKCLLNMFGKPGECWKMGHSIIKAMDTGEY